MATGDFCWFDLMTTDLPGARRFYQGLFGWDIRAHAPGYFMIHDRKGQQLGGMMAAEGGMPSVWLAYVTVDPLENAVQRIKEGGGRVFMQHALPNVGRFAIFADPQGAVLAVIQHANPVGPYPREKGENHISWSELHTSDPSAALAFYQELFSWPHQMHGEHYILVGTEHSGGILKGQPGVPPHWLCYVNTENTDRTVAQVLALGGRVVMSATDMPGVGRFAVLTDPGGAVFAVMGA